MPFLQVHITLLMHKEFDDQDPYKLTFRGSKDQSPNIHDMRSRAFQILNNPKVDISTPYLIPFPHSKLRERLDLTEEERETIKRRERGRQ